MNNRGIASAALLVLIALGGLGAWGLSKTKLFHGESRRAAASTETTQKLLDAQTNQNGKAASTFAKIGEMNNAAPDSPQKLVINRLVPIGLSLTGEPDAAFLLELEKLANAQLTGKLDQANQINSQLLQEASRAKQEVYSAIRAKQQSDLRLEQAAAEQRGAEQQSFWLMCLLIAGGALYLYTKVTHLSPGALAEAVKDIRSGTEGVTAIDGVTSRLQQRMTRLYFKLFH